MKLASQPMVPWAYLDSPAVTPTWHSCRCEGPGNVGIGKTERVVRLHNVSEELRSAGFRHFPHSKYGDLSGTVVDSNPKYSGSEQLLPLTCSNQTDRILYETRHGSLIATALHLPLLPEPSLISMRLYA